MVWPGRKTRPARHAARVLPRCPAAAPPKSRCWWECISPELAAEGGHRPGQLLSGIRRTDTFPANPDWGLAPERPENWSSRNFGLHVLTGISSRARPLAHTRGVRPAVYLLCACCLREMASLVLRVDVRVYTCSKTRNGCWPWPEGVTLAPPKSTWEQPHPGRSRDLKTWVLEMKPGNCTKPGFSTRFSMLRMDPKSPDSGRA